MRQGGRLVADLGAPDDGRYDPDGFWPREKIADTGLDPEATRARFERYQARYDVRSEV